MILGYIVGKITTTHFSFKIERQTKKFDFVQVYHKLYDFVLCQVIEIERGSEDIAKCVVLGRLDEKNNVKGIRVPFDRNSEVLKAEDSLIKKIIHLSANKKNSAFIGVLDNKDIRVYLDLQKLLTKHIAVLAKSGAGKSYCVGVLIEEILNKKIPLLIIDPHGEYSSLAYPNTNSKDLVELKKLGLEPKGFDVNVYGDSKLDPNMIPLRISSELKLSELTHLLPKLSSNQQALLYSAIQHIDSLNFTNIIYSLESEESNLKFGLINIIKQLKDLNIFSENPTPYTELIKPGSCSIVSLKGISPDAQEIIIYKLLSDLFELRKKDMIAPFFLVIEEAHNFCPERNFGEKKSSKIIRTIASEGRKFGLGLCVVSQRPARVDKSVLSQCSTQIILKVTNPNDLKAVANSVEGITSESIDEIQSLPVGSALITGIFDIPLFVNIRPRMSKHGGEAVDILNIEDKFFDKVKEFKKRDVLPLIKPNISVKDVVLMNSNVDKVEIDLVPGFLVVCKSDSEFNLLIDRTTSNVVLNVDEFLTKKIPELSSLSRQELSLLKLAFKLKSFSSRDIAGFSNEILHSLISKGYIVEKDRAFFLSENYIFSRLDKFSVFSKIIFESINYHNKFDPVFSEKDIRAILEKYVKIVEFRECYIVKYSVIYKD